jgi:hypothetical protein
MVHTSRYNRERQPVFWSEQPLVVVNRTTHGVARNNHDATRLVLRTCVHINNVPEVPASLNRHAGVRKHHRDSRIKKLVRLEDPLREQRMWDNDEEGKVGNVASRWERRCMHHEGRVRVVRHGLDVL